MYAGLIELINNGVNQCRAVIAMTDGGDNSSTRQPSEIIALANRHRIRIFTIGLGSSINSVELELIAQLTGGKYFQTPNAGQLAAIYQEISTIMFQGFQECIITYERQCADGSLRTVELMLKNYLRRHGHEDEDVPRTAGLVDILDAVSGTWQGRRQGRHGHQGPAAA